MHFVPLNKISVTQNNVSFPRNNYHVLILIRNLYRSLPFYHVYQYVFQKKIPLQVGRKRRWFMCRTRPESNRGKQAVWTIPSSLKTDQGVVCETKKIVHNSSS